MNGIVIVSSEFCVLQDFATKSHDVISFLKFRCTSPDRTAAPEHPLSLSNFSIRTGTEEAGRGDASVKARDRDDSEAFSLQFVLR